MDYSPTGSSVHGIFQARKRVGCHFFLQGIFASQGLNLPLLHLLHWQADSLPLAPLGKPILVTSLNPKGCTCVWGFPETKSSNRSTFRKQGSASKSFLVSLWMHRLPPLPLSDLERSFIASSLTREKHSLPHTCQSQSQNVSCSDVSDSVTHPPNGFKFKNKHWLSIHTVTTSDSQRKLRLGQVSIPGPASYDQGHRPWITNMVALVFM